MKPAEGPTLGKKGERTASGPAERESKTIPGKKGRQPASGGEQSIFVRKKKTKRGTII